MSIGIKIRTREVLLTRWNAGESILALAVEYSISETRVIQELITAAREAEANKYRERIEAFGRESAKLRDAMQVQIDQRDERIAQLEGALARVGVGT